MSTARTVIQPISAMTATMKKCRSCSRSTSFSGANGSTSATATRQSASRASDPLQQQGHRRPALPERALDDFCGNTVHEKRNNNGADDEAQPHHPLWNPAKYPFEP